ncbi:TonB-dependent siderophore receptor [Sphingomonas koreensis]|uniref:TonB-dependent receptor n=1 Tax=Sphingomonas koreensis TaxID=93064 RepID=UPI00082AA352|nr:TonB-dependent siderophore receptor [Sphingomonas koreensis]PJI87994.1 catecholate siderophore receptor [Sphingomonas koreensis]RSU57409.1 TonB-dependent siderophore receptor [Sphingomonas koreensis]RSU65525.1 TonB-dependent siderophore receptor [Sphingomonas koreensis]
MTRTTSDGRKAAPAFLALAAVGFIASAPAQAAEDDTTVQQERDEVVVTGQETRSEQASPKATRPVRDTPQTVTILTNKVIEEQNLLTLRDVLSTVPGITFGAAEGGIAPSDQITLRGYSASSDITTDGVRDSAPYSRSDPFNLEQVEVTNGANSVYNGSGSVGGSINIVTKRPKAETEVAVQAGIGTDDYYRGTIDANVRVNELVALRLNAMVHKNDVPGRDVENYDRWGVAPSATIGIDGPTSLTLQYLHQEESNIPQYGVPYYKNGRYNGALPGIDRSDYFGYRNVDTQEITVDQATITASHEFSDRLSLRNLTRWQSVSQRTIVGPPQGTFCLTGNIQANGTACPATVPVGYYLIGGPRGNVRDTTSELMYNQIDLSAQFATGAVEHSLVLGASAGWEKYFLSTGNVYRNANRTLAYTAYPLVNWSNPNEVIAGPAGFNYGSNVYTGPINYVEGGRQRGEVTNYAVYLFDTMKFGKFELNGGVRYENNSGNYQTDTSTAATATVPQGPIVTGPRFYNKADLFTYRVGLVFKPVETVTLYAAYGNAQTPSQSAVNGACVAATCNVDPESAKNYEIGAKAEVGRALFSVALFRNERDQYKVPSNDINEPDQVLDGHSRVDGIAVSATGNITPAWSITANYTYLEPKLIRSVAVGSPDPAAGAELQNVPNHSGSLYTTYTLPFGLKLGYGLTYQGSFALNLPTAASAVLYRSDDYLVHNASISYDFSPNFSVLVNVKNFTNELYYTRIRNNGWATPGDARAAVLTVGYRF